MTSRPDPRIGTTLGPYRIERVIGRGGMGVVYRATDTALDRPVALKLIAPHVADDEAFRARFLRESKMAAAIDHPNIIPIYEAGERDGTYFLAMRYVDGIDLEQRLRSGPLEPRVTVAILGQLAGALDAAHAAGLVHRDVKPANLLIASGIGAERDDHVYLTDFGLTKQSGSETGLTRGGGFVGTLEYIAPEQIEGKPSDGRADQYALAAIAVACLTGQAPFQRDSDVALINAHLHVPPPSVHDRRPELPPDVDPVVARGLAKDPATRYPDCRAFVDALREALGVTGTHERPAASATSRRDPRVPLILGAVAIAIIAVVAVIATANSGSGAAGTSPGPGDSVAAAPGTDDGAPSTSPSPAATENAFPNASEAALIAILPAEFKMTCDHGPYGLVNGWTGGSTPIASVTCAPGLTSGASSVVVRRFPQGAVASGFGAGVIGHIALGNENLRNDDIPPGDCATSKRANGRWSIAGVELGPIVCFTESASGDAILWWAYDAAPIVVKATNQRGDSAALYTWFVQNARFITP